MVHGDGFDAVTTNRRWVATLGAVGYTFLLRINRVYNQYRRWRGKPQFSLSKIIKAKVKSAVSYVGKYEEQLQVLAETKGCKGIICGHIHTPANKQIGEIHYLNSGDWVETLSAVVENLDRSFEVIYYESFRPQAALEAGSSGRVSPSPPCPACRLPPPPEHYKVATAPRPDQLPFPDRETFFKMRFGLLQMRRGYYSLPSHAARLGPRLPKPPLIPATTKTDPGSNSGSEFGKSTSRTETPGPWRILLSIFRRNRSLPLSDLQVVASPPFSGASTG